MRLTLRSVEPGELIIWFEDKGSSRREGPGALPAREKTPELVRSGNEGVSSVMISQHHVPTGLRILVLPARRGFFKRVQLLPQSVRTAMKNST